MRDFIIFLGCIVLLSSCDAERHYDQYQSLSNGWELNQSILFSIEENDTLQPYDIFINVRNNNDYPYNNLFLITKMDFPNGKQQIDTLEYEMAAPDGTWLGSGFSDLKESKLWYREGVRFRESGTYTFAIKHAVRKNGNVQGDTWLKGITEVGLRIERTQ